MNKGLNYSEKLEAYIRNELSENEKLELEEQLRQDPLLQNELVLQKDIISSICDYRRGELKQRLNKIDVGSGRNTPGDFSVGGAILGGLAIVGVAGFLIFKDSGKELSSTQISSSVSQMPYLTEDSTPAAEPVMSENNKDTAPAVDHSADSNTPETPAEIYADSKPATTASKKAKPAVAPVVVEAKQLVVKDEEIRKDDHLVLPENGVSSKAPGSKPTLIIVDNNTSRYKLHYKYTNDQLFLYGFEKPYKIIDLPDQTQRYLLYDGNFYKLNRNQPQIAPIQQVENQQEIKALESYKTDNP
jgi:hypothetical protein